ncbi:hypothetical protein DJ58_3331 [Yersinia frederiksenii ATCC 33641]|uniref:Uncharacterized protein n=1 Tax=Yersinia frederiksenii ATCC 33641 TaxID=349966 RepID=A0ABR4VXM2_YERFR|nr:hypothetical protein CRN75_09800 [Yersinia frederiksenii]KGA44641.1 hypothetical protein DJ58_3331 [Yersinia frederiksenii ATCC 33641]
MNDHSLRYMSLFFLSSSDDVRVNASNYMLIDLYNTLLNIIILLYLMTVMGVQFQPPVIDGS